MINIARKKIITCFVIICFLLEAISCDYVFGLTAEASHSPYKLAAPSLCDNLLDIEQFDMGRIKFALQMKLKELFPDKDSKESVTFGKWKKALEAVSVREKTVFSPADIQLFVHEAKPVSVLEGIRVMCRIREDGDSSERTYYAVFSPKRNESGEFPIKGVFTEKEYENNDKLTRQLPKRRVEDSEAIDRYARHNEMIIDQFIRDIINNGDFAEIKDRAGIELEWDTKYPDRRKPGFYWDENYLDIIASELDPFLNIFGINLKTAFKGKNIVFLKVPEGCGCPVIYERVSGSDEIARIEVKSHASDKAVYFFLESSIFDALHRRTDINADISRHILSRAVHEIGVIFNLDFKVLGENKIVNDLDRVYDKENKSPEAVSSNPLCKAIYDKIQSIGVAKLSLNLKRRDYSGSESQRSSYQSIVIPAVDIGATYISVGYVLRKAQRDAIHGSIKDAVVWEAPVIKMDDIRDKGGDFITNMANAIADKIRQGEEAVLEKGMSICRYVGIEATGAYNIAGHMYPGTAPNNKGLDGKNPVYAIERALGGTWKVSINNDGACQTFITTRLLLDSELMEKISPSAIEKGKIIGIFPGTGFNAGGCFITEEGSIKFMHGPLQFFDIAVGLDENDNIVTCNDIISGHYFLQKAQEMGFASIEDFVKELSVEASPKRDEIEKLYQTAAKSLALAISYINGGKGIKTVVTEPVSGVDVLRQFWGNVRGTEIFILGGWLIKDENVKEIIFETLWFELDGMGLGNIVIIAQDEIPGIKEMYGKTGLLEGSLTVLAEELSAMPVIRKDSPLPEEEITAAGIEQKINKTWQDAYPEVVNNPCGNVAQEAFRHILWLDNLRKEKNFTLTPEGFYKVHSAVMFYERNYRKVIEFFEDIGMSWQLKVNTDFCESVLYHRDFFKLYILARRLDADTINEIADKNVHFFEFYIDQIFGEGKGYENMGKIVGPDPEDFASFMLEINGLVIKILQYFEDTGRYAEALRMIEIEKKFCKLGASSTSPLVQTLSETAFREFSKDESRIRARQFAAAAGMVTPPGKNKNARLRGAEYIEREIELIWNKAGRNIGAPFSPEAQDAFRSIFTLMSLSSMLKIPLQADAMYKVCYAELFSGFAANAVLLNFFRGISNDFKKGKEARVMPFDMNVLYNDAFLVLYFTAKLIDGCDIAEAEKGDQPLLDFWADQLFGKGKGILDLGEALRKSSSNIEILYSDIDDNLDVIMTDTAVIKKRYPEALKLTQNRIRFYKHEMRTRLTMNKNKIQEKISKLERLEQFFAERICVAKNRHSKHTPEAEIDKASLEKTAEIRELAQQFIKNIKGNPFSDEVQEIFSKINKLGNECTLKEMLRDDFVFYGIMSTRLFGTHDYKWVISTLETISDMWRRGEEYFLCSKILHNAYFLELYFIARMMDTESIDKVVAEKLYFFKFYSDRLFGEGIGKMYCNRILGSDPQKVRKLSNFIVNFPVFFAAFHRKRKEYDKALRIIDNRLKFFQNDKELYKDEGSQKEINRAISTLLLLREEVKKEKEVKDRLEKVNWHKMDNLADQAGRDIPTHPPAERYTLLMPSEFFKNRTEFIRHKESIYHDRFDLESIDARNNEEFVTELLGMAKGKEDRSIALVPHSLTREQLKELTDRRIRFIRTDVNILLDIRAEKGMPDEREKFQKRTYVMMLLARHVKEEDLPQKDVPGMEEGSAVYQTLRIFVMTHFKFDEEVSAEDYIGAILKGKITTLIKGILAYKPPVPFEMPKYDNIATIFISA